MHPECLSYLKRTVKALPPVMSVVELGSHNYHGGAFHGGARVLFPSIVKYVGIDMQDGPGVDVVAGATQYEPDEAPELVVLTELLEHTDLCLEIIANAYRMLAPDGRVIITTATTGREPHSALGGGPLQPGEHYGNISRGELDGWLRGVGFTDITIEVDDVAHDIRAHARKA